MGKHNAVDFLILIVLDYWQNLSYIIDNVGEYHF